VPTANLRNTFSRSTRTDFIESCAFSLADYKGRRVLRWQFFINISLCLETFSEGLHRSSLPASPLIEAAASRVPILPGAAVSFSSLLICSLFSALSVRTFLGCPRPAQGGTSGAGSRRGSPASSAPAGQRRAKVPDFAIVFGRSFQSRRSTPLPGSALARTRRPRSRSGGSATRHADCPFNPSFDRPERPDREIGEAEKWR
jgi:hypothetical protein